MDNYGEFIERLNTAFASLQRRRNSLGINLDALTWQHSRHAAGLQQWERRRALVAQKIEASAVTPAAYQSLSDLQDVARNMESMFRKRTERIDERRVIVQERCAGIDRSLQDLERSKLKLESSRMLRTDRENLRKAMIDLAGTPETSIGGPEDPTLHDELDNAREAIALAEALLELKDH